MKKSLLALAVLGAFAGVASAQSSVTVYGIVDVSVARHDNGDESVTRLDSGRDSASRIGFKGVEDLGNGLKASFVLESGFNADTGVNASSGSNPATNALFSRLSYVGLGGGFGEVRLGRQYAPVRNAMNVADPFENGGMNGAIGYMFGEANGDTPERVSNQVTYLSPKFGGGFDGEVSYVFGETEGSTSDNRGVGARLGYKNGPINVQFGYSDVNDFDAGVTDADTKIALLAGSYDFGVAKAHLGFGQSKTEDNILGDDTAKNRSAIVGVTVPFGASKVRASYIRNDNRLVDDADSNAVALSYSYALSKRTSMYASYVRVDNDSNSEVGAVVDASAPGENVSGVALGIKHTF